MLLGVAAPLPDIFQHKTIMVCQDDIGDLRHLLDAALSAQVIKI